MKDLSFIKTLLKKNINFVNGFDMGIPLNIIQSTFTTLHYGDNIITSKHHFILQIRLNLVYRSHFI